MIGEQIAKKGVLAVEDPEIAAVAMVPIAGDVFRLGIVLAGGLMLDGHAEIVAHAVVSGLRNGVPLLVAGNVARFGGGIGEMGTDGADLLLVGAVMGLHVDEQLVP